jgi:hypothetical protein
MRIQFVEERLNVTYNHTLEICPQGVVALFEAEVQDGITQRTTTATSLGRVTSTTTIAQGPQLLVNFTRSNLSGRVPFEGRFTISTDSTGRPSRMISVTTPGITTSSADLVQAPVRGVTDGTADCASVSGAF